MRRQCLSGTVVARSFQAMTTAKTTLSILALSLATVAVLPAQGAMRVAPSGRGISEVTLTFADSAARAGAQPAMIRVNYGQPHLRGRQLHTAGLVPYDTAWRLGANEATTLTTDVDLVLGGTTIPRGSYVLHALPTRSDWKLILQKNNSGSPMVAAMAYNASNDVARVDLRHTTLQSPVESLSIWLIPSTTPGNAKGELRISWGNTQLSTDWATK